MRNGATVPGGGTLDSGYDPPLPPSPLARPMLATLQEDDASPCKTS